MGDTHDVKPPTCPNTPVVVPPIPKLGDTHSYWIWRMLIKSYLKAMGLWSRDRPKECAHTKFVILSTVEIWVLRQEYEELTCASIFDDLHTRFNESTTRYSLDY